MEDLDARLRLTEVLSICENETHALGALRDPRLSGVLRALATLQAEVVAAIAGLTPDASDDN